MTILITGGAGFIGSNFCHYVKKIEPETKMIILDALTYAGNLQNLQGTIGMPGVSFVHGSITNQELVVRVFNEYQPDVVVNFAAETHVDRSVHGNTFSFIETNITGAHVLLEAAKKYSVKRFIQVSTDEVYGSLPLESRERFTELYRLEPNSPYSSSKAAADLICRAYFETYSIPVIITRCTNNFGPRQFPEKVLPYWITLLMEGKRIPIYGDGQNVRDWIHVDDHCRAIYKLIHEGVSGEIYNIGVGNEWSNIDVAKLLLKAMNLPESRIRFVTDRPAHDRRYALDAQKLFKTVGFNPEYTRARFEDAIFKTVNWYVENKDWIQSIRDSIGEFNPHIEIEPEGKMLIFGKGFLGSQYALYFAKKYEVKSVDKEEIDVRDANAVLRLIENEKPDVVINAVAITDLDWCETNRGETINVNTIGADNIARACEKNEIYLVHISSGCIQESVNETQVHSEEDAPNPTSFYSWTKVFAEQLVIDRVNRGNLKTLILRPRQLLSAVLSPRNALAKMLTYTKFVGTANSCTIVDDLLRATCELIEKKETGIFNIVNPGITSPLKIAERLKAIIKPDMQISEITKSELNKMTLAERIDSVLSIQKLESVGIMFEPIDKRLDEVIIELKKNLETQEGFEVLEKVRRETSNKLLIKQIDKQTENVVEFA